MTGLILSDRFDIAAGPTIAVVVSSVFAVSLVVSPHHGLLARRSRYPLGAIPVPFPPR